MIRRHPRQVSFAQLLSSLFVLCLPLLSFARPQLVTQEKSAGDTTIRLTLEEQFILDDQNTPCLLEVVITGDEKPMTMGDSVTLKVFEDDVPLTTIGDDLLWEFTEEFSATDIENQRFERRYECNTGSLQDWIGGVEVYALAEVDKEECGFLCGDDPSTSNINVDQVDDDMAEDDDSLAAAVTPPRQGVSNRIAKDPDWLKVTYTNPILLMTRVVSRFEGGMLNFTLLDEMGAVIEEGVLEDGGAALRIEPSAPILPGQYYLQVTPSEVDDFNFYDLEITESVIQTDCAMGATEERPCDLCGKERRSCNEMGMWEQWGGCEDRGVCEPGAEELRACGEEGSQSRVCQSDCSWGEYTSCAQCEDGAEEMCYSGPDGTSGVGQCRLGLRVCTRGSWSACQGDVWPTAELCADGLDNDCDGTIDLQDTDCVGSLGAACSADQPCATGLECLGDPFPDGYCGLTRCEGCDGVCASVLGGTYCLTSCDTIFDCRPGYLCSPVGMTGQKSCTPPCLMDSDCGAGERCADNICVTADGSAPMTGGSREPIAPPSNGDGCSQSQGGRSVVLLLLLAFLGIRARELKSA